MKSTKETLEQKLAELEAENKRLREIITKIAEDKKNKKRVSTN